MKTARPKQQKGAVAIEFAAVFMIFFGVFYGLVSYSLPLMLLQSFHQSTAEAVRQSVSLDPVALGAGYGPAVVSRANAVTLQQLSWLPTAFKFGSGNIVSTYSATNLLTVTITYPSASLKNVLPFLVLPVIGAVPNLPVNLTAQSSLQF